LAEYVRLCQYTLDGGVPANDRQGLYSLLDKGPGCYTEWGRGGERDDARAHEVASAPPAEQALDGMGMRQVKDDPEVVRGNVDVAWDVPHRVQDVCIRKFDLRD
jgi:hypothetical protein